MNKCKCKKSSRCCKISPHDVMLKTADISILQTLTVNIDYKSVTRLNMWRILITWT